MALHPPNNGFRIRAAGIVEGLARLGPVTVLGFGNADHAACPPHGGTLALPIPPGPIERLISLTPSLIRCFRSEHFRAAVARAAPDHDLCFCLGLQMTQYYDALPAAMPRMVDNINVESDILLGLAARRFGLKRLHWLWHTWKLRRYERRALAASTLVLSISDADRARFLTIEPRARVITVAPGLELASYRVSHRRESRVVPGRLVFVGALDWHVNVEAACWMAREVMPLVRSADARARLLVVGRAPTPEVCALAELEGVEVHADVPGVGEFLASAQAVVVPLRFGSGVQTKLIEALAAGRPVVTTAVGLEGLVLEADVDVCVADDAAAFATQCLRAMSEPAWAESLARSGQRKVLETYTLERLRSDLRKAVHQAIARAGLAH